MYGRVLLVSMIIPFQTISTIVSLHYSDDFSMKTINEPVLILHAEDDHIIPIKCGFKVGPYLYYLT